MKRTNANRISPYDMFYSTHTKICSVYPDNDSHVLTIIKNNADDLYELYCTTESELVLVLDPHYTHQSFDYIFSILIDEFMTDTDPNYYSCAVDSPDNLDLVRSKFTETTIPELASASNSNRYIFSIINVCGNNYYEDDDDDDEDEDYDEYEVDDDDEEEVDEDDDDEEEEDDDEEDEDDGEEDDDDVEYEIYEYEVDDDDEDGEEEEEEDGEEEEEEEEGDD